MIMKKFATGFALMMSMAIAVPALADPITLDAGDVGTTFQIDLNGFSGSNTNTVDGLASTLTFTLDSVTSDRYDFSYVVANTTGSGVTSNISSFAFNVDPDITGAAVNGAYQFAFVADGNGSDPSYPNQIGAVDVCFKASNSGSCSNSGGVSQGNTGTGSLSLLFGADAPQITLSDFFVRYQGITGAGGVTSATGESTTSTTTGGSTSGTPVPEPGILGLLGLALASLCFMRRRRQFGDAHVGQPAFA
ncbi:cistern family PEP-CTERM protein [Aurantiacibacter marinus]|uniref:Ice-binding protein C-terminal domain-containing protein n=1 Tax=Aurantiacibacter marinus TaxID=874156 RepID=A0A0H0XQ90_9SPHN|nr:cistern family PEP-CTERM protein [Aurantiacibacter marinus]KLI64107.1 hypothetical protein AAV99_09515 [Aurantiacibacter marinus]